MITPSLQLKNLQQLTLTPQLQQAIKLLQLSTLELCQEIQTNLENNPLLEIDEHFNEINVENIVELENIDASQRMESREIPEDIPLDASLNDMYSAGTPSGTSYDYPDDEQQVYQGETKQTLNEYLIWQLNLTRFSDTDRAIATTIIEAIDERGYLTVSLQEILEGQGNDEVELDEIEAVLKRIQYFDPIGVGARSLQECLLLQINQLITDSKDLELAKLIIENHLDLLGVRDFKSLKKQLNINDETLKNVIGLIQQLQPYPGDSINTEPTEYVIPDILVKKIAGKWQVMINHDSVPQLKINQKYAAMAEVSNEKDSQYIRQALQDANWFIKSVQNRNETLIKVSQFIVEHQQDFFEYGDEYMKPLILADVAEAIEMHNSTISRVTTQKYLQCDRGVFELKYFFSSHVNTESGNDASSTAIKAMIKKMIANEDSNKPLSDSKIATLLENQGMIVARRTVAKYREELAIPPSSQRKQLN